MEDTLQKWYEWLEVKKKDEKEQMEECINTGSAGLLDKISKPTAWRRGAQILANEQEDAMLLDRCEARRKEWAKTRAV